MNNKEVIIEKILSDAQAIADENISKAQEEIKSIEANTNKVIDEYASIQIPKGKAQVDEVFKRKEMVTNLDCKKVILSKKREVIDNAFSAVADYMRKNAKDKYVALIKKMIELNADDGDVVIISKKDEKIITKEALKGIKKKVTLSETFGDFDGGIMLSSDKFDKNLTFDTEFELIKEENESEIAKILFGE